MVGGQLILGQVGFQQDQRLGRTKLVVDVQLQHHPLAIPILLGIGIEGHFRLAFQQDQGLIGIALGQQEVRLQQLQLCLLHRVAGLLLQLLIQGGGRFGLAERQIAARRHHLPGEGLSRFGGIHLLQIPLGILGQIRERRRHAGLRGRWVGLRRTGGEQYCREYDAEES
ncbi:hypothetical protein D3C79_878370 [compost metagenome]